MNANLQMVAGLFLIFVSGLLFRNDLSAQNIQSELDNPNIILLLVDDLGAVDLGCTGSSFYQTPRIDELAGDSISFPVAYAPASVCSPSRASLLTGIHPVRLNITDWIPGNNSKGRILETPEDLSHLPLERETIAETLNAAGYRTYFAGKWHLGGTDFAPDKQGFDVYFDPHHHPESGQPRNQPVGDDRPHATRTMTDHLIDFLNDDQNTEQSTDQNTPFFAVLSYYDVHTPIVADSQFLSEYQAKAKALSPLPPIVEHSGKTRAQQDSPPYASMVSAVDQSVGRIMDALKQAKKWDNTIVIFTSDNGGLSTLANPGPTSNSPLRSGKGWLYEGGIRVPLLIRIPTIEAKRISAPVSLMDLYPTIAYLADVEISSAIENNQLDGIDLSSLCAASTESNTTERLFAWHYPHYHGSTWTPGAAIRKGPWKLIHFYETNESELYDLENDPNELSNQATAQPELTRQLLQELQAWQQAIDAKIPNKR